MKHIILAITLISQVALAKPGKLDPADFNDVITENVQAEPALRKSIQDLSGLEKEKVENAPSFKPTKQIKDEISDQVAVTLPKKKVTSVTTVNQSLEEAQLPRVSEEVETAK